MPFQRVWDSSCPREYSRWTTDGATWVIQDLPPEDNELALELLVQQLAGDELLCSLSELLKDPVSVQSITECWKKYLPQRTSLACYEIRDGRKTLAGVNACLVQCREDDEDLKVEGEAWKSVYGVLKYIDEQCNAFDHLGVDKLLYALGLVVRREYRGHGLGSKILAARKPLALSMGIKATSTVFTGPASQKSAESAGFTTIYTVTLRELADAGFQYPRDERQIKLMVEGEAWKSVYGVLKYIDEQCNAFDHLGVDKLLYALGLVVRREYRGHGLGSKILAARKPLALSMGIKATSTVFTSPASQKSAESAGFTTIYTVSLRELADAGFQYPRDERQIKLMVNKFV